MHVAVIVDRVIGARSADRYAAVIDTGSRIGAATPQTSAFRPTWQGVEFLVIPINVEPECSFTETVIAIHLLDHAAALTGGYPDASERFNRLSNFCFAHFFCSSQSF
jgi:hypothetical protein